MVGSLWSAPITRNQFYLQKREIMMRREKGARNDDPVTKIVDWIRVYRWRQVIGPRYQTTSQPFVTGLATRECLLEIEFGKLRCLRRARLCWGDRGFAHGGPLRARVAGEQTRGYSRLGSHTIRRFNMNRITIQGTLTDNFTSGNRRN